MPRRRHLVAALFALGVGCITRSLPLPPPSQIVQSVLPCAPGQCPDGGVVVRITGTALPNARVVAEVLDVPMDPSGELLGAQTRATASGQWQLTINPAPDSRGVVRAARRGSTISIFQVNDMGEASLSVNVVVPR